MKTKICTDIDQSKKLIELGIDTKTADMSWYRLNTSYPFKLYTEHEKLEMTDSAELISAWSLSALLDLMPKISEKMFNLSFGYYDDRCDYISKWCFNYLDISGGVKDHLECYADNSIDAVFKLFCILKKKKLI